MRGTARTPDATRLSAYVQPPRPILGNGGIDTNSLCQEPDILKLKVEVTDPHAPLHCTGRNKPTPLPTTANIVVNYKDFQILRNPLKIKVWIL